MKKFKDEFLYSRITIQTPSAGKITIDTNTADPETWSKIPEVAHMIEDVNESKPSTPINEMKGRRLVQAASQVAENLEVKEAIVEHIAEEIAEGNYSSMTLNELRDLFPHIKATSKKAFIDQLK